MKRPSFRRQVRAAYRSGLEVAISAAIVSAGVPLRYESFSIPFTQPAKERKYTPDFLLPNGIIVESKGLFTPEDRSKMVWVKAQHPDLDLRMVFSNAKAKLYKGSRSTYADWCDKHGFPWAHKAIPPEWYHEGRSTLKPYRCLALRKLGVVI